VLCTYICQRMFLCTQIYMYRMISPRQDSFRWSQKSARSLIYCVYMQNDCQADLWKILPEYNVLYTMHSQWSRIHCQWIMHWQRISLLYTMHCQWTRILRQWIMHWQWIITLYEMHILYNITSHALYTMREFIVAKILRWIVSCKMHFIQRNNSSKMRQSITEFPRVGSWLACTTRI